VLEPRSESPREDRPVRRLLVRLDLDGARSRVIPRERLEALRDRLPRAASTDAVLRSSLRLSFAAFLGKPAPTGQSPCLDVDDEVALALDQHRHRHRLQAPGVLEGLQLVELEDPA